MCIWNFSVLGISSMVSGEEKGTLENIFQRKGITFFGQTVASFIDYKKQNFIVKNMYNIYIYI